MAVVVGREPIHDVLSLKLFDHVGGELPGSYASEVSFVRNHLLYRPCSHLAVDLEVDKSHLIGRWIEHSFDLVGRLLARGNKRIASTSTSFTNGFEHPLFASICVAEDMLGVSSSHRARGTDILKLGFIESLPFVVDLLPRLYGVRLNGRRRYRG